MSRRPSFRGRPFHATVSRGLDGVVMCLVAMVFAVGSAQAESTHAPSPHVLGSPTDTWESLLSPRTVRSILVAPTGNLQVDQARAISVVKATVALHGDLLSADQRFAIESTQRFAEVDRVYSELILQPMLSSSREDARQVFDSHRDRYRRSEAATLLEIYLWAPEDLPEIREKQLARLNDIRTAALDQDTFSDLAEEHSDAPSHQNGGRIGSIRADQVDTALRGILFTGQLGPTEIVSNEHGHYLFWVVDYLPASERTFDEVANRILTRLRNAELETLRRLDRDRLVADRSVELGIRPTGDGEATVFTIDGRCYTAARAGLPPNLDDKLPAAAERRAFQIARDNVLRDRGVEVQASPERVQMAVFRAVYPQLVESTIREQSSTRTDPPAPAFNSKPPRAVPKWDFELLLVADDSGDHMLSRLLRARHELGDQEPLEAYRDALLESDESTMEIVRFDGTLAYDAAALGPEIYRTLKHHLGVGRVSRPLHLPERGRFAIVRLIRVATDLEAGRLERQERQRRRARRAARAELERRILSAELQSTPDSPTPLSPGIIIGDSAVSNSSSGVPAPPSSEPPPP
jgi:hypothetical protein